MREYGQSKELHAVPGGVCAPAGFLANGVCVGIDGDEGKRDFALIVAEKRCVAAGVFSQGALGDPACLSQKRLKFGCGQAIAVNSGRANVFLKNGEEIADEICRSVEKHTGICEEDVLIASTGKIGKPLFARPFLDKMEEAVAGLGSSEEHSRLVAEAMMTTDKKAKQLSYEFRLGSFRCKIGAVFKGNGRVCPNMATTLAFITTDVNITPRALKNILRTEVKDTLNLLTVDGISSPNDCVIVFANGKAGNYTIDREDSDYKKFSCVLREVLTEICIRILTDGGDRAFFCRVCGAKSKQAARKTAKALMEGGVKRFFSDSGDPTANLLYSVWQEPGTQLLKTSVYLRSEKGKLLFMEEGEALPCSQKSVQAILDAPDCELVVDLGEGNFSSVSFGLLKK